METELKLMRRYLELAESKYLASLFPKEGELYYYLTGTGGISSGRFGRYPEGDAGRKRLGNCYRSRNEAKVMQTELRRLFSLRREAYVD